MPPPPSTVAAPPTPDVAAPAGAHRERLLAALLAGVLAVVALTLVIAGAGGSAQTPPATGAASLVPADALLYLHLSTDPSRPAVRRARALMATLPDRGAALLALPQRVLDVVGGHPGTVFARDLGPWVGKEVAFALLNTSGGSAGSLTVLDVRDRARALRFLAREGAQGAGAIAGAPLYAYPTGAELAFVGHYLVVGADADVRSAIEVDHGRAPSLAASAVYRRASADAPAGRVLDAYAPSAGVLRILDARGGFLGALGSLLSPPALMGVQLTVAAQSPGLVVHLHLVLDHATAAADPRRLQSFHPTLAGVLPSGSTLMIDARNLRDLAPIVFGAIGKLGLYARVPDLLRRLGAAITTQGVSPAPFLALFGGETAVALAHGAGAPALVIVTRTANPLAARETLANTAAAVGQVLAPSGDGMALTSPPLTQVTVGGVSAQQVSLGPGLALDFAVVKGLIVIATSPRGIADVVARAGALDQDAGYRAVLGNQPDQVTSLGFADFSQLLSLGEQTQLASSAGYRSLLSELQRVRAVGLQTTRGENDTTAELSFQIP